jgi:hypothetical protein
MGSSMVMMWPPLLLLRWSIKAASEVDLPEPVPPTNRIRPRFSMITSSQHLRQAQILDAGNVGLDVADHHRDFAALLEDVDPEPTDAGLADGQIHLQGFLEFGDLGGIHHRIGDLLDAARRQRFLVQAPQHPLKLAAGRRAGAQIDVGAVPAGQNQQEVLQLDNFFSHCHDRFTSAINRPPSRNRRAADRPPPLHPAPPHGRRRNTRRAPPSG